MPYLTLTWWWTNCLHHKQRLAQLVTVASLNIRARSCHCAAYMPCAVRDALRSCRVVTWLLRHPLKRWLSNRGPRRSVSRGIVQIGTPCCHQRSKSWLKLLRGFCSSRQQRIAYYYYYYYYYYCIIVSFIRVATHIFPGQRYSVICYML